jgi:hypothetical protein
VTTVHVVGGPAQQQQLDCTDTAATVDEPTFKLTPTHHLILGILSSRLRLAENFWTFTKDHRRHLEVLAAAGLIEIGSGHTPGDIEAKLTGAGKIAAGMRPDYQSPLQKENKRLSNLLDDLLDRIPKQAALIELAQRCHTCPFRNEP